MSYVSTQYGLPEGTVPLENQVAGHVFQEGTNSIGLIKDQCNGTVLKPAGKPVCAAREINFYKSLKYTDNIDLQNLKNLVPDFKETIKMQINGKEMEFIRLEDLTFNMIKPCIMDIKIGKRTWDPEASLDKIQVEEEKYSACKIPLGLCIPGFQLYSLNDCEKLKRFSKEYGKQLNEKTFIDTMKLFLNFDYGYCKELITQILYKLKLIQSWAHKQKSIKLYSSSILIIYDAIRLKNCIDSYTNCHCNQQKLLNGSTHKNASFNTNYPSDINNYSFNNSVLNNKSLLSPQKTNSIQIENDVGGKFVQSSTFVRVKMIDFAHVFPSTDDSFDTNYLYGVENLVKIFENFLKDEL